MRAFTCIQTWVIIYLVHNSHCWPFAYIVNLFCTFSLLVWKIDHLVISTSSISSLISLYESLLSSFYNSPFIHLASSWLCFSFLGTSWRNLLSIDSRLNRIDPSTNIFPPNPERGYRTIWVTNGLECYLLFRIPNLESGFAASLE